MMMLMRSRVKRWTNLLQLTIRTCKLQQIYAGELNRKAKDYEIQVWTDYNTSNPNCGMVLPQKSVGVIGTMLT